MFVFIAPVIVMQLVAVAAESSFFLGIFLPYIRLSVTIETFGNIQLSNLGVYFLYLKKRSLVPNCIEKNLLN